MKSNFSMKEEKEEEENKNKMDFVSRVERRILINLSRRFFLPFVIHKEGKGPLIFLPISRSNFSNTWIPFEPPPPLHFEPIRRMKVVRILLVHDSVHVSMKYRGRIIWAWIIRGQNRDLKEDTMRRTMAIPLRKSFFWDPPDIRKSLRRETILVRF